VRVAVVEEIASLEAAAWDALSDGSQPFVRHAFLHALEKTGRVGGASGWEARGLHPPGGWGPPAESPSKPPGIATAGPSHCASTGWIIPPPRGGKKSQ